VKLRIILIHGTWAHLFPSGALAWFEEGSSFQARLSEELTKRSHLHEFAEPFRWSGRNSIDARYIASGQLAERIKTENEDHPSDHILLVCHSHGGNVALLSLVWLKKHGYSIPISIVTMATPFLWVNEVSDNDPRFKSYAHVDNIIRYSVIMIFVVRAIYFLVGYVFPLSWWPQDALDQAIRVLTIFGFMACGLWLYPLVNECTGYNSTGRPRRPHLFAYQAALVKRADAAPSLREPFRMLVLRGADDEAAFALMLGSLICRTLHISTVLIRPFATLSFVSFPILFGVLLLGFGPLFDLKIMRFIFIFTLAGVVLVPLLLGLLLITANMAKGFYGSELFFNSARCDITAHSAPDTISNCTVNSVPPSAQSGTRLVHRLYDNSHCASLMAEWV
jgi:hypothetical protein